MQPWNRIECVYTISYKTQSSSLKIWLTYWYRLLKVIWRQKALIFYKCSGKNSGHLFHLHILIFRIQAFPARGHTDIQSQQVSEANSWTYLQISTSTLQQRKLEILFTETVTQDPWVLNLCSLLHGFLLSQENKCHQNSLARKSISLSPLLPSLSLLACLLFPLSASLPLTSLTHMGTRTQTCLWMQFSSF